MAEAVDHQGESSMEDVPMESQAPPQCDNTFDSGFEGQEPLDLSLNATVKEEPVEDYGSVPSESQDASPTAEPSVSATVKEEPMDESVDVPTEASPNDQESQEPSPQIDFPSSEVMSPTEYASFLYHTFGYQSALIYAQSCTPQQYFDNAKLISSILASQNMADQEKQSKTERKPRENYEKSQQVALERFYAETTHPTMQRKQEIADQVGLSYPRVQKWFENRRQKDKRAAK
uniref:Homeobox domain-containing protein n=1 Tax=Steinernema glaseri TaxID=37863 RepID=A0A1I8ABG8_9BILA